MREAIHILVTGGAGQVGLELARTDWPSHVVLHMPPRSELDLSAPASVQSAFAQAKFAAVINCGAYTGVDKAETDVAAAFGANAMGPAILAEVTRKADVPLIQVSTDYVFDGSSPHPYVEDDATGPLGVYGASKLAGELAVRSGNPRSVVLRTAWVLSIHRINFLKTMLRLGAERSQLRVVGDQHGCPTSARDIASALQTIALKMIADPLAETGIYHFVNAGETTWAELAKEIFTFTAQIDRRSVNVVSIATSEYPTPARRPSNSRLSSTKLTKDYQIHPRPWREAVAEILTELHAERAVA
ncbi:MAG: dTDP-4-dehydrorhamnose reductase [bacterium]|nr:dTDP-4-dehydrorhamnose reductase [bacterium]